MEEDAIIVDQVVKSFPNRLTGQPERVLSGISFVARKGAVTVLMGQSGCGKSTLFRILIGDETADQGRVVLLGTEITKLRPGSRQMETVQKKFGILFQNGALFNSMTVGDNIAFPIREHQAHLHPNIIDIMVDTKLNQVELAPAKYKHKMPATLSGGERKRVGLARALALDPELIFYDEPSAGLDPIVSRTIDQLIKDLVRVLGISSLVVTHELDSAFTIADHMVLLKRAVPEDGDQWTGSIVYDQGSPVVLKASRKPYTVEFLGEFSDHTICLACRQVQAKHTGSCIQCGKPVAEKPLRNL